MPEPATGMMTGETRVSSAPTPGTARLDSQPTIGSNSGRFRERNPDMIAVSCKSSKSIIADYKIKCLVFTFVAYFLSKNSQINLK